MSHRQESKSGFRVSQRVRRTAAALAVLGFLPGATAGAQSPPLELRKGDRIVLLGNTMAERLQLFNHFETLLMPRFPDLDLVVRNLGWSGDTITLQPRPLNFGDAAAAPAASRSPDVILAFFGLNESFDGRPACPPSRRISTRIWRALAARPATARNGPAAAGAGLADRAGAGRQARLLVDVEARNRELARYTETMRRVAARRRVTFVDLFTPTGRDGRAAEPLTINGIHVNESGDRGRRRAAHARPRPRAGPGIARRSR